MADIKTCEQYVLAELENYKWDVSSLKAINAELDNTIGELKAQLAEMDNERNKLREALNVLFMGKLEGAQYKEKCIDVYGIIQDEPSYKILKDFVRGE